MTAGVRDLDPGLSRVQRSVHGWGGGEPVSVEVLEPGSAEQLERLLSSTSWPPDRGAIARGLGRSYGDAAQRAGGTVLDMTRLGARTLDRERGVVTAQAGVTIGELLAELVPAGWMLPVVPGTQHVTVGGAIASDIHGKNHADVGSLGKHVLGLGLLGADGVSRELRRGEHDELLAATIGGMGLTGVVLWARIALKPVRSALMSVDTDRAGDLDEILALLSGPGGSYRVAWLDLLGPRSVRGVVTRAEHRDRDGGADARAIAVAARATVPDRWPGGMLRVVTARAFNELRYRRAPRSERARVEPLGRHLFPLDVLDSWPRLYGADGLVQYQCALPAGRESVLYELIGRVRGAVTPCFLAVLKDFGPSEGGPLSFPIAGWTLALDLPRSGPDLIALLDELDVLVADAGGRVYLTKDSRLLAARLGEMYPRLGEWRAARDRVDPERVWQSDLALRTGLIEAR
jgi:decaprenylphospho-beta-D-ribofuranose 2-oxidase